MILGKIKDDGSLKLDLDRLMETRLLIQANSGGGKSWAIRKLLEETHGRVQQVVLDIEGDFASLREKFDFILVGKGGDIEASPRTAELLAHKILEMGISVVIDLYELKQHERISFVARFLDAMTNSSKDLWHPVLVVIDEAHLFAPESGHAESMGPVIDLATRGRKRGFCSVLATQRLSKLHKDVAAECINKMIGRTGLDIDMKRAADELGFSKTDMLKLRDLDPGEFFCFGPALTKSVERATIGDVKTQHPRAGKRQYVPVPPTEKIRKLLAKLTDLPHEAEKELKDKNEMKTRIKQLEQELRKKPDVNTADIEKIKKDIQAKMRTEFEKKFKETMKDLTGKLLGTVKDFEPLKLSDIITIDIRPTSRPIAQMPPLVGKSFAGVGVGEPVEIDGRSFGRCERAILQFLAMRQGTSFNKTQISVFSGYSKKSSGFNNALSNLRAAGVIHESGSGIAIADWDAVQIILGPDYKSGDPFSPQAWLQKLGKCERAIYEKLLEAPDIDWEKHALGEETGYSVLSSGFNNALSALCTLGLAQRNGGTIRLNPEITDV